ncbi:hypothetical protein HOLleu_33986 [Holothuria leucospilota]|uniref:PHD-type domain-containing protein n=1 Tax=Holothuria leucospilota TaxID=206669 RepID=A0A9Q0YSK3_HOLLE|nr:hypothetical protein HOLleu_33986 [Holothuria leucospilota]
MTMFRNEPIVTWLTKCVRENSHGEIIISELKKGCHCSSRALSLMLKILFPSTTVVRRIFNGKKHRFFQGIEIIQKEIMVDQVYTTLSELKKFIPPDVLLMQSDSDGKLLLHIPSNLSMNGNTVLKTLKLSTTDWELWVRGRKVNLSKFDIDNTFRASRVYLNLVLDITRKISLCEGFPYEESLFQESRYLKENIQHIEHSEGKPRYVVRSRACKQVVDWFSKLNTCVTCKRIYEHRNSQEEIIEDNDHGDMTILLEKCFPYASDDMKILLKAQQDVLQAKGATGRRYGKDVISTCQSLRLRSPLGYEYLRRSGMLILPTRRHLRRYTNVVHKDVLKCTVSSKAPTKGGKHTMNKEVGKLKGKVKKSKGVKRKTGKRTMNKKKGKGKGKVKKSKRVQWPCGGCHNECSMDCVCCDSCSIWFHYQCLELYGDEAELEEEEWFCPECKSKKADGDVA